MGRPRKDTLAPLNLDGIGADFRAGILNSREIGVRHGCSHTTVNGLAKTYGWTRDLKAKIDAKRQELLAKKALSRKPATHESLASERDVVLANGAMQAAIVLSHRMEATKAREMVTSLMREAEAAIGAPELYAQVYDTLVNQPEPDLGPLREMVELVSSLPARTKVMKDLLECLTRAVALERVSFGMDDAQKAPQDVDSFESLLDLAGRQP